MGRRIDLVEFIGDVIDSVSELDDAARNEIASRLAIVNASRAADLQDLLLKVNDDD